jgi:hypothetical protein
LQSQYYDYDSLPLSIEGQVTEITYHLANPNDQFFYKCPYLNHLPYGATYAFVELDLSDHVSESVYKEFRKQIEYREKQRKKKKEKEECYSGKV